jgi:hypothetical protein
MKWTKCLAVMGFLYHGISAGISAHGSWAWESDCPDFSAWSIENGCFATPGKYLAGDLPVLFLQQRHR